VTSDGQVFLAPEEIDLSTSDQFAEALGRLDPDKPVVVDCSRVRFIDSSGLRVLVLARQERTAAGGSLVVANAPESMHRLLEITGLLELLDGQDPG